MNQLSLAVLAAICVLTSASEEDDNTDLQWIGDALQNVPRDQMVKSAEDDIDGIQELYVINGGNEICDGRIDAISLDANQKKRMVFKGNKVYRIPLTRGGVLPGYPKLITVEYAGLPRNIRVTAAMQMYSWMYLFSTDGNIYIIDDRGRNIVSVKPTIFGLPEGVNVKAAFNTNDNKKVYVFTATQYYRITSATSRLDAGYPKLITAWRGLPNGARLDATFMGAGGYLYFFYGPYYFKFNLELSRVEPGYPKTNADKWLGCVV